MKMSSVFFRLAFDELPNPARKELDITGGHSALTSSNGLAFGPLRRFLSFVQDLQPALHGLRVLQGP